MTIISLISGWAASDSTAAAIVNSSLRAGTIAETVGLRFMGSGTATLGCPSGCRLGRPAQFQLHPRGQPGVAVPQEQIGSRETGSKGYYIGAGEKKLKHKILGPIALILVAAVLYVFAAPSYRQGEPSLAGRKAKDFDMQITGASHLSDLRGKVVVLNFWASWCPPCLEETQSLNTLQQAIASRGGVVLGISVDEDKD